MTVYWISRKFSNPTLEQFLFHFQYGSEGLEGYDTKILLSYLRYAVVGPMFTTLLIFWLSYSARPLWLRSWLMRGLTILPLVFVIWALAVGYQRFSIATYFTSPKDDNFFITHYTPPSAVNIVPKPGVKTKNLVIIYVESLEAMYSNAEVFGQNLLAPLSQINGVSVAHFNQVAGANWTIAGIVASQCGIPLKPMALASINSQGEIFKTFLAGAECLPDTLAKFGYTNVFMGGAELHFAGKGKYFTSHHYNETWGQEQWRASGRYKDADYNAWGLQDDDLFREAKHKLDALVAAKKPFNLTLLTVNTHFPEGFFSKTCTARGGKNFTDIVTCTAHDIADFINYMKDRGYLEHTQVLVTGDHLTMPNAVYEKLSPHPNRSIYNLWISQQNPHFNRDWMVHFDVAPTLLEFLGFNIEGGRYGLGYSLLGNLAQQPSREIVTKVAEQMQYPSAGYQRLWLPPSQD